MSTTTGAPTPHSLPIARLFADILLALTPTTTTLLCASLHSSHAEGYIGMALMGGAAAVGGLLLAGLLRRRR